MVDPLTALGLASNIISFIDFGSQVLSKGRELHRSASGHLIEHEELGVATQRLRVLRQSIDDSIQPLTNKQAQHFILTPAEIGLQAITSECQKIADEFENTLAGFAADPTQSQWKSFRQAFKAVWNKEGLERMKQELSHQREQLILHLLVVLSEKQGLSSNNLLARTSEAEVKILQAVEGTRLELRAELDKLRNLNYDRSSKDMQANFARGITAFEQTYSSEIQMMSERVSEKLSNRKIFELISNSLHFHQIRDRKLQIDARAAHPHTFEWIFKQDIAAGSGASSYAEWLKATLPGGNLFWVAGRPGSGKSTLMHFLSETSQTEEALASWKGQRALLRAATFFWLAGSPLQKSLSGLLRGLLYDLMNLEPSIVEKLAEWRWRSYAYGATSLPPWTNVELMQTLRDLVIVTAETHQIFLLIDGLDEFEGSFAEQRELVDYLKALADCGNVKICVSSRPWAVFESAFAKYPNFRLERLTQGDIALYVNEKFAAVDEFKDIQVLYPEQCSAIVHDVVQKAQGVFLWVYLVVLSLSQGMIEGDSILQLRTRLDDIPSDLEEYFRQILDTIPEQYRPLAGSYFDVMTATATEVSALTLSFLEESKSDFLNEIPVKPVAMSLIDARKRSMARRLESRCKGLLQVNAKPMRGAFGTEGVDYLHRTVRDFILSKDIQQVLQQYPSSIKDPLLFLCRSVLAQMKMVKSDDPGLPYLATQYLSYAREFESSTGSAHVEITKLFFKLAHGHLLTNPKSRDRYGSDGSILTLTITWRLIRYSLSKLTETNIDVNRYYSVHPWLNPGGPETKHCLLWECIPPGMIDDVEDSAEVGTEDEPPVVDLFAALFARGADPNLRLEPQGLTVWEYFLQQANSRANRERPKLLEPGPWTRTARLFIKHGASGTGQDPRHKPQWRERAAAGKKYRYNVAPQDLADAVKNIFAAEGKDLEHALRTHTSVTGRFRKLFGSK